MNKYDAIAKKAYRNKGNFKRQLWSKYSKEVNKLLKRLENSGLIVNVQESKGSVYLTVYEGCNFLTNIRISDHKPVKGGGIHKGTGKRYGNTCINIYPNHDEDLEYLYDMVINMDVK